MGAHQDQEREQKTRRRGGGDGEGALAGVPVTLPALTRALKLQAKAAEVGFDWNDPLAVLAKIREEADEIEAELTGGDRDTAAAEVGDLLFAVVNLARHLGIDPESALRGTNQKFERRFAAIERGLAELGKSPRQATLAEMDGLWNEAKAAERTEHIGRPNSGRRLMPLLAPSRLQWLEADAPIPCRCRSCRGGGLAAYRATMADPIDKDRDGYTGWRQPGFRQPHAGGKTQRAAWPIRDGREFIDCGRGGMERGGKVAA